MTTPLLQVAGASVSYGSVRALHDVSIDVAQGTLVTIIGSNGAGKSTLLNAISGLEPLEGGSITFDGQRIDGSSPHEIVRAGVSQVPEGRRIFGNLDVEDNLLVGGYVADSSARRATLDEIYQLFPLLHERRRQEGGTLSGGEQQMLAIGRALMARPRLLMLDEPSLGLAPLIVAEVFRTIESIRRLGTTVLLVEQNSRLALKHAEMGYVLETGRLVLHGSSAELQANPEVQRAYLGGNAINGSPKQEVPG